MSNKITVEFLSDSKLKLASLTMFGDDASTNLYENGRYEYELDSSEYSLKEKSGVIRRSRIEK